MADVPALCGVAPVPVGRLWSAIQRLVENGAAALLVALILILAASVTARYAFGRR